MVVNSAAINIGVHVSFQIEFSLGICPRVGLLDHMITLFLVFEGISILFSIVTTPIYILTNSVGGVPLFSTSSPAFIICRHFDDVHSDWCEAIDQGRFDLHFSNN